MKPTLPLLFFLGISMSGFSQTTAPKDTAHKDTIWKIHGQNTFLLSQSSFSNWAAGGVNSFAGNLVLDYDFDYKKAYWRWDNKVILGYGLSDQSRLRMEKKNDDRIMALNSLLGYKSGKILVVHLLRKFSNSIYKRLLLRCQQPTDINISIICPGLPHLRAWLCL